MYNILAINKTTKNTLICENFVEDKDKKSSLQWWKDNGMSSVNYICKRAMLMAENFPSNKVAKLKRDSKISLYL